MMQILTNRREDLIMNIETIPLTDMKKNKAVKLKNYKKKNLLAVQLDTDKFHGILANVRSKERNKN